MAKISLNKITPVKNVEPKVVIIGENEIIIEQYLPIGYKADFIERVLNNVIDDTGFLNPIRLDIMFNIELIRTYTNISITDKMLENPTKVYDLLVINGILNSVLEAIPEEEYEDLYVAVEECAKHTSNFMTSFAGMIRTVTENYGATKMNVEELMNTLGDSEKVGLVKDILDKLG